LFLGSCTPIHGQKVAYFQDTIWPVIAHQFTVSNGFGQDAFGDLTVAIGVEYSAQLSLGRQVYAGLRTGFQLPEPGAGYALIPVQLSAKWLPRPTQRHPWYGYGSGGYAFGWSLQADERVNQVQGGWGGEMGVGRLWKVGPSAWVSTSLGYLRQRNAVEYDQLWWWDAATITNTTTMNRLQWRFGLFF